MRQKHLKNAIESTGLYLPNRKIQNRYREEGIPKSFSAVPMYHYIPVALEIPVLVISVQQTHRLLRQVLQALTMDTLG